MPGWDLVLFGVGFRQAAVDLRETLALTTDRAAAMLGELPSIDGLAEAAVLSTCNRTEFYLVTRRGTSAAERWLETVRRCQPQAAPILSSARMIERLNADAARHLFRVGCGLESALLGDVHIPAQLRQAYALALRVGTIGPVLARTFPQAFRVSRQARRETCIGQGTASLGAAVAAFLFERCPVIGRPRVLVVGAGIAARDIARCLAKRRRCQLVFVNRTADRAAELARTYEGDWIPWAQLAAEVARADVLVAAVAADAPIVTASDWARRPSRAPLLVVDVGVPRNVEPPGDAAYVCIDDIAQRREKALASREGAVAQVVAMIDEEVVQWQAWRRARGDTAACRVGGSDRRPAARPPEQVAGAPPRRADSAEPARRTRDRGTATHGGPPSAQMAC